MELKNKTVVLTGASGGIGKAIARELDKEGASLLLVGRDPQKLYALNAELNNRHTIICADLTTTEGRKSLFSVYQKTKLDIDVLINNAGVSQLDMLEAQKNIEKMIAINLTVPIQICQLFLPMLKRRTESMIVNVGSTFGSIGYPGFSVYCGSKFGLRGFTQALARELDDSSVDVVYIAPRATNTDINDDRVVAMNKELGNAMDDVAVVAKKIVDAVRKNRSSEIYLGWPEKLFIKINAILPSLVSKSLQKNFPVIARYCQNKVSLDV